MSKKEDFKSFISQKPYLASYVDNGKMTWQKFYELYDLYGEDSEVWNNYDRKSPESLGGINKINNLIKGIDVNSIKEHITTAQKALDFVQELTSKEADVSPKTPVTPRPLNKFFED